MLIDFASIFLQYYSAIFFNYYTRKLKAATLKLLQNINNIIYIFQNIFPIRFLHFLNISLLCRTRQFFFFKKKIHKILPYQYIKINSGIFWKLMNFKKHRPPPFKYVYTYTLICFFPSRAFCYYKMHTK